MYTDRHIKEIQDAYRQEDQEMKKSMVNGKGKQIQDEEVFLYDISPFRLKTLEPIFIQDDIDNLEKYMKYMQSSVTTTLFYPSSHYKSI